MLALEAIGVSSTPEFLRVKEMLNVTESHITRTGVRRKKATKKAAPKRRYLVTPKKKAVKVIRKKAVKVHKKKAAKRKSPKK